MQFQQQNPLLNCTLEHILKVIDRDTRQVFYFTAVKQHLCRSVHVIDSITVMVHIRPIFTKKLSPHAPSQQLHCQIYPDNRTVAI